jgi:hypothetical protein
MNKSFCRLVKWSIILCLLILSAACSDEQKSSQNPNEQQPPASTTPTPKNSQTKNEDAIEGDTIEDRRYESRVIIKQFLDGNRSVWMVEEIDSKATYIMKATQNHGFGVGSEPYVYGTWTDEEIDGYKVIEIVDIMEEVGDSESLPMDVLDSIEIIENDLPHYLKFVVKGERLTKPMVVSFQMSATVEGQEPVFISPKNTYSAWDESIPGLVFTLAFDEDTIPKSFSTPQTVFTIKASRSMMFDSNIVELHFNHRTMNSGDIPSTFLTGLPRYFHLEGALDDDTLVGLTKGKPFIYSIQKRDYRIISEANGWNLWISPDKKSLAYNNEQGIAIIDIESGKSQMVLSTEEMVKFSAEVDLYPEWGYDSKSFLLIEQHEWDSFYHMMDLTSGTIKKLNTDLEGYFLTEMNSWLDEHRILFSIRANAKQDGTSDYTSVGYRSDLAVYDLRNHQFKRITEVEDDEFAHYIGHTGSEVYYLKYLKKDDDVIGYYSIDVETGESKEINLTEPGSKFWLWDTETYIMGVDGKDAEGQNFVQLSYVQGGKKYDLDRWGIDTHQREVILLSNAAIITNDYKVVLYDLTEPILPRIKEDVIQLEGMDCDFTFKLYRSETLGLATYAPEGLWVENGENSITFYSYGNGEIDESAKLHIFTYENATIDGMAEMIQSQLKTNLQSDQITIHDANKKDYDFAFSEKEFYIEGPVYGGVSVFKKSGKVYGLYYHYPGKMGDGMHPRVMKIINDIIWLE